jgi:pimeloyl-ACP methyl ester carboxylesterase
LHFGPGLRASLRLSLFIPPESAGAPFPVFLTQASHRDWALIALRRGYLACVYAGADSLDDTDTFVAAYPDYDWSRLMRRAWAGSRCIDYLARVPQADMQQIAITGHSRNGKQSLMAAAFDERISLVISSSSGAGGVLSARDCSEQHFGEGIELITRRFPDWFHPRFRFFTGREDKLPVDLPDMVALAAPRPCLLSIALNDHVESTWAMQQTYLAVQRVYTFLGVEDRLRILWRYGSHETSAAIIERYLDWCDTHFGRAQHSFPERLPHPWDWQRWQAASRQRSRAGDFPARKLDERTSATSLADWNTQRQQVQAQVEWMLGDAPPALSMPLGAYGEEPPHVAALMERLDPGEGVEKQPVVFGEYLCGDVYTPAGVRQSGRRLPAILWLHPWTTPNGYVGIYRRGEFIHRTLARAGYAVFCFDQIGFGRRIEEVEGFYRRHPDWSLLGKMLRDARAGLDALGQLPYVDSTQIWGLGYGLGSMVGLHLGALDDRLAGLASVCGPPAFGLDKDEARTGGIRRWSHQLMLLPRLGYFAGNEERIPYDISDLLACFAPRPVLVVSPQLDRDAPPDLVTPTVDAARCVYSQYGAAHKLEQLLPEDYNRFGPEMQEVVVEWLARLIR